MKEMGYTGFSFGESEWIYMDFSDFYLYIIM